MEIKAVALKDEERAFLTVPWLIHKDDKNWIPPLDREINRIFDPSENPLFKLGSAKRWILKKGSQLIGRIAAFDHPKYLGAEKNKSGGIGFFDCFYDHTAANLLFDTAIQWLSERGIDYIEGPINFGEKDRFWGLLAAGFTEPAYGMNYHPPYYKTLFDQYGFKPYYHQYTYERPLAKKLPSGTLAMAEEVMEDPNYTFKSMSSSGEKNMSEYAKAFQQVYNREWEHKKGLKFVTEKQAKKIMGSLEPVLVPDLIWFAYYRSQPIAYFLMIPDMNQVFKQFRGRFGWWERLKLRYNKLKGGPRKTFGLTIGVDSEYQDQGVEGALMLGAQDHMQKLDRWDTIEMTWIVEFNTGMINLMESLGAEHVKTHITYRLPLSA